MSYVIETWVRCDGCGTPGPNVLHEGRPELFSYATARAQAGTQGWRHYRTGGLGGGRMADSCPACNVGDGEGGA